MTLLMTALRNVKDTSQNTICQNNLREIGTWAAGYSNDNGGILPHNGGDGAGGRYYKWLSDDLIWDKAPFYDPSEKESSIFLCPTAVNEVTPKHSTAWAHTYSVNHFLGGHTQEFLGSTPPHIPKVIHLTPDKYWFGESKLSNWGGYRAWPRLIASKTSSPAQIRPWVWDLSFKSHKDRKANFMMGDGRISSRSSDDVETMTNEEFEAWSHK